MFKDRYLGNQPRLHKPIPKYEIYEMFNFKEF